MSTALEVTVIAGLMLSLGASIMGLGAITFLAGNRVVGGDS